MKIFEDKIITNSTLLMRWKVTEKLYIVFYFEGSKEWIATSIETGHQVHLNDYTIKDIEKEFTLYTKPLVIFGDMTS